MSEGRATPEVNISAADGEISVGDLLVTVGAEPRPLRPYTNLEFSIGFTRQGHPVAVVEPRVSLTMTMDMGPHDYRLVRGTDGRWRAGEVVLPLCASGSRLWFGNLSFLEGGQRFEARFRFELAASAEH